MDTNQLPRQLLASYLRTPRKSGGQSPTYGQTLRNTSKTQDRAEWRKKCKDVVLDLDLFWIWLFDWPKNRKSVRWGMFLGNIEPHDIGALTGERIWFVRYYTTARAKF